MIPSTLFLGLLGLATASPVPAASSASKYPTTETSKGFRLVVNVTDPSKDFKSSPIQNKYISSIHTGAGTALVGVIEDEDDGRIFYQNGTQKEYKQKEATIITDGGTPLFPSGLKLVNDPDTKTLSVATLDAGAGTPGVQLSSAPGYTYLLPETYIACNESLAYYGGAYFIVIKHVESTVHKDGTTGPIIPKHCAPVRLLPECTALEPLPKGSYSSHKYALNSKCYKDVSKITWSKYSC